MLMNSEQRFSIMVKTVTDDLVHLLLPTGQNSVLVESALRGLSMESAASRTAKAHCQGDALE